MRSHGGAEEDVVEAVACQDGLAGVPAVDLAEILVLKQERDI